MRSSLIILVASGLTTLASPLTDHQTSIGCSACPGGPCDAVVHCPMDKCCGVKKGDDPCVDCPKPFTCSVCPGSYCLALIECPIGKCCGAKKGDAPCIDCPSATAA